MEEKLPLQIVRIVEAAEGPLQEHEIRALIPNCPPRIHWTLSLLVRQGVLRVGKVRKHPEHAWSTKTLNTYEVVHG